jgi:hypothetical protein
MVTMNIQIIEEQARILNQLAANHGMSLADIIHQIIKHYIQGTSQPTTDQEAEKALTIIGAFSSEHTDLSIDHDHNLVKICDGDTI